MYIFYLATLIEADNATNNNKNQNIKNCTEKFSVDLSISNPNCWMIFTRRFSIKLEGGISVSKGSLNYRQSWKIPGSNPKDLVSCGFCEWKRTATPRLRLQMDPRLQAYNELGKPGRRPLKAKELLKVAMV